MAFYVPSIFRHEQEIPSDSWTIVHNMSGNGSDGLPIVDTFIFKDSQFEKIIPLGVTKIDRNTVRIDFSIPRIGFAVVIV